MATVTTGDIISINVDGTQFGQQILLTTHWQLTIQTGSDPDMDEAIDAIRDRMDEEGELGDKYINLLSDTVDYIKYVIQDIFPVRYVRRVRTPALTQGQNISTALPQNLAVAITVRSDLAGIGQRATKHIGGLVSTFVEEGMLTPAAISAYPDLGIKLTSIMQDIVVGATTFDLRPIIYKRTSPESSVIVNNFVVQDTVRVMRRRTVRVGS